MKAIKIKDLLCGNPYPGRGILVGLCPCGASAMAAYFIMGRSANSRNRIFVEKPDGLYTKAFDEAFVQDPSLIIYRAMAKFSCPCGRTNVVITNGDQTDTIMELAPKGSHFEGALATRQFEPDAPNWTPRISSLLSFADGDFTYKMNILKSADSEGSACNRFNFAYCPIAGEGHFLSTYETDGNPLPSFEGEPRKIIVPEELDDFAEEIWQSLDSDNKISLFVCKIDIKSLEMKTKVINKNC